MRSEEVIGRTHIVREVKDKRVVVKRTTYDQPIANLNAKLRSEEVVRSGKDDLKAHPRGAKISYAFQADPIAWEQAKRERPDLFNDLLAPGRRPDGTPIPGAQYRKELAAQRIANLYPQFVAAKPKPRYVPGSSIIQAA
jgi:hypothetical protein